MILEREEGSEEPGASDEVRLCELHGRQYPTELEIEHRIFAHYSGNACRVPTWNLWLRLYVSSGVSSAVV